MLRDHAAAIGVCLAPLVVVTVVVVGAMAPAFWAPPPYPSQPDTLAAGPVEAYAGGVQETTLSRDAHSRDPYGYGWSCCDTSSTASSVRLSNARVVSVHSHLTGHDGRPSYSRVGYFYVTPSGDVELHARLATGRGDPGVTVVNARGARERVAVSARGGSRNRTFSARVDATTIRRWNGAVPARTLHVNATAHRVPSDGSTTQPTRYTATRTVSVGDHEAVLVVVAPDGHVAVRVRPSHHPVGE